MRHTIELVGNIAVTRAFLQLIRQGSRGRSVNFFSLQDRAEIPYYTAYPSTKFRARARR
jgi:short-subunit dehydrogenase